MANNATTSQEPTSTAMAIMDHTPHTTNHKNLHQPPQEGMKSLELSVRKMYLSMRGIEWLILGFRMDIQLGILEMFVSIGLSIWGGFRVLMELPDMLEAYFFPTRHHDRKTDTSQKPNEHDENLHQARQEAMKTLGRNIRTMLSSMREIEWLILGFRWKFLLGILEMFYYAGCSILLGLRILVELPEMLGACLFPSIYRDDQAGGERCESNDREIDTSQEPGHAAPLRGQRASRK